MRATISKWGNSQGLRLPKSIVNDLNLSIGDEVKITTKDNKVIIEPIKQKRKYNIKDLVKDIPSNYRGYEEFNNKMGKEEW
jgi:antitoxin MazE